MYPSKSHGIGVGASTPSDAKTAELYTAAAVAKPVPATAPSTRGRDTRAALAASLVRNEESISHDGREQPNLLLQAATTMSIKGVSQQPSRGIWAPVVLGRPAS